jgi:Uncharacterized conserved protein (DUF2190)
MLYHLQPFGPFTFTVGAAAIEANTLVQFGTDGLIVKCGADTVPNGFTNYAYAIGAVATVYQALGEGVVQAGAAVAIGDFVKSDANGRLICNGTTGSTANDAKTLAMAESAATTSGDLIKVFFIHCA